MIRPHIVFHIAVRVETANWLFVMNAHVLLAFFNNVLALVLFDILHQVQLLLLALLFEGVALLQVGASLVSFFNLLESLSDFLLLLSLLTLILKIKPIHEDLIFLDFIETNQALHIINSPQNMFHLAKEVIHIGDSTGEVIVFLLGMLLLLAEYTFQKPVVYFM